ncbi:MAG: DUF1150 family protein [Pseudomonadota bacterium]
MTDTPAVTADATPIERRIVYVRQAGVDMLPDDLKASGARFYSVHDEAGNVLALAPNRPVAFALAERNDLKAVSVH